MGFSSALFLFGFLPAVLFVYYVSPRSIKNYILLAGSLIFYAWGEVFYIGVLILSIVVNYYTGKLIFRSSQHSKAGGLPKLYLALGIALNAGLLLTFKYANFAVDNLNILFTLANIPPVNIAPVHLPIGISFFTFQAISYIIDVYRRTIPAEQNIYNFGLYISLFPELLAGPIIRYPHIAGQITGRIHSPGLFAAGIQRFIFGLAKKMLIANPLGEVADNIYTLTGTDLTMPLAWIGALAYTLQIYFDFSGYSDMAIGLGRMFGFTFLENFNYPYISRSVREFWRRWHISLSTWFRDYVYIPLGGNQVSPSRIYGNIMIVFALVGVWHGASWNFVVWGLFHAIFLAGEHAGLAGILDRMWKPLRHVYVMLVVTIGWVFFRAESLQRAVTYLGSMADVTNIRTSMLQYAQVLSYESICAFAFAIVLSLPVYVQIEKYFAWVRERFSAKAAFLADTQKLALLAFLLFLSILKVASSTYNAFIYFRF